VIASHFKQTAASINNKRSALLSKQSKKNENYSNLKELSEVDGHDFLTIV